jgi:phage shock protein PspC (stress-responsive transcriptional regulator)
MLRFVLDVLLLRNLIESRSVRVVFVVFLLGALIAGLVYAYVFLNAANERSRAPHVHAHSTH